MARIVLLDSAPLGLLTNPKQTKQTAQCARWMHDVRQRGVTLSVPEITDYELRRELLRAGKTKSVLLLDALHEQLGYTPLSTVAMQTAANLWADIRTRGIPTADPKSLDCDVILAAQALVLHHQTGSEVVIATADRDLERFATASMWWDI